MNVDVLNKQVEELQRELSESEDKRAELVNDLQNINNAFEEAGVEVGDTPSGEYGMLIYEANENWFASINNGRTTCYQMFMNTPIVKSPFFDMSKVRTTNEMFGGCKELIEVPDYDISNATDTAQMYRTTSKLKYIPNFVAPLSRTVYLAFHMSGIETIGVMDVSSVTDTSNCFYACYNLKDITYIGIIPMTLSFQYSPLTVASMKSIITHLKNYKGTDKELTYSITFSSGCWDALEASGPAPHGNTWKDYVGDVLGWST